MRNSKKIQNIRDDIVRVYDYIKECLPKYVTCEECGWKILEENAVKGRGRVRQRNELDGSVMSAYKLINGDSHDYIHYPYYCKGLCESMDFDALDDELDLSLLDNEDLMSPEEAAYYDSLNDKGLKLGDTIKTRRGYIGIFITNTIDGKIARVMLDGCTYSDDHWYDEIPMKDIWKAEDDKEIT